MSLARPGNWLGWLELDSSEARLLGRFGGNRSGRLGTDIFAFCGKGDCVVVAEGKSQPREFFCKEHHSNCHNRGRVYLRRAMLGYVFSRTAALMSAPEE